MHDVSKLNGSSHISQSSSETLLPKRWRSVWFSACLLISPQHRGSDATRVCAANNQHGLPELSAYCTGAVAAHERWETDWNTVPLMSPSRSFSISYQVCWSNWEWRRWWTNSTQVWHPVSSTVPTILMSPTALESRQILYRYLEVHDTQCEFMRRTAKLFALSQHLRSLN